MPSDQHKRLLGILDYIDENLDSSLDVDSLSQIAFFSKFHFQRVFSEMFGVSVKAYINLLRTKRAAHQLAFRKHLSITQIAFASGYQSNAAFSHGFKALTSMSPSAFRRHPDWQFWSHKLSLLATIRNIPMQHNQSFPTVRIEDFPETPIAELIHRGPAKNLMNSVSHFIEWRKLHGTPPSQSSTFNILYDDPQNTPESEYRFGIASATKTKIDDNPFGVIKSIIPAGRCAVLSHQGSDATLAKSISFLYREWLYHSGNQCRDFPLFLKRIQFFPDVPEHQALTDIYLPIS